MVERRSPQNVPALVASLTLLAAGAVGAPLAAATSCYDVSCATSCSPTAPAGVSVLVPSSAFPAGANTPIAFVDPADGLHHRLVATQEGAILVWDGDTGTIRATPFLDLRSLVEFGGERGLLALAVDPDYATTGTFYVYYTRTGAAGDLGDLVLARYQRSAGDPEVANAASGTTLLVIEHSGASNHNGGWLAFGPDGFLYLSIGDGGGSCDGNLGTGGDAQRSDSLLGKILRLDVRGIDPAAGPPDDCGVAAGPYEVPSTNPFFGQEPACDEVWAMGLRNPFRFGFDAANGDLYIGDVGQSAYEEIDLLMAGAAAPRNFGWVCREGCATADNAASTCATGGCPLDTGTTCQFPRSLGGYWDPILCHTGSSGWHSIMGGYRYRGHFLPALAGSYVYGDAACGQIWRTTTLDPAVPASVAAACWASGYSGTYGFAQDRLGELYLVRGGAHEIDCFDDGSGCRWAAWGLLFADGFESDDRTRWSASTP